MSAGVFALGALASVLAALAVSAAPALAATGNAYRAQSTGSETAAGGFPSPAGLAVTAGGDVYVDAGGEVIDEFGSSGGGTPLMEITPSEAPEGSFSGAGAIAVNGSGDLFVTNPDNSVYVFNSAGKYESQFDGAETKGGYFSDAGVAVDMSSGDVYVSDAYHKVVDEFEHTGTGYEYKLIKEFNGEDTKAKSFSPIDDGNNPTGSGLAVNTAGDLYVIDSEHDVVDEFAPSGALLEEFASSSGFSPEAVAVAPSGEVYIADHTEEHGEEHAVVNSFSSAGAYLSQFEGAATPQAYFPRVSGLAVGAVNEEVYVDAGRQDVVDIFSKPVAVPVVTTGAPSEEQKTSVKLTGTIEPTGGLEASCQFLLYGADYGNPVTVPCVPAGPFSSLNEVQAEVTGLEEEEVYDYRLEGTTSNGVSSGEQKQVKTLGRVVQPPTVSLEPITTFTQNTATFSGEVNPNEVATTYHFEYSADGMHWTQLADQSAGEGTSAVPVTEAVTGLTGNTTYHVRLVAVSTCPRRTSGCGTNTAEETFKTLAGPPKILGSGAADVTSGEATLLATIYPEGQPSTTYRFEYGPTETYGTTVPAGEGHIGVAPTQVTQVITGLMPDTTYHFRVVASNGVGSPAVTADRTFRTYSASQASSGCPNEQVRSESDVNPQTGVPFSLQLPECRAYEMVSPTVKNGAPVSSNPFESIGTGSTVARVGAEGSTVTVRSSGIWPGGEQPANNDELATGAAEGVQYKIVRGVSGWEFKPEVPSNLRVFDNGLLPNPGDMGPNGIWSGAGPAPAEALISHTFTPNLYLLESNGALAEIGPSVPIPARNILPSVKGSALRDENGEELGAGVGVEPVAASVDLSHMLFNVTDLRWPFDQSKISSSKPAIPSLYEYTGTGHTGEGKDVPTLVGVDNRAAQISQCGTRAAGYEGQEENRSEETGEPEARSISAAGSTVFFSALAGGCAGGGIGPAVNQLYARVGEPGPGAEVGKAVTVNVAGITECGTSDSCNVTEPVVYQGAATDGSRVFFTSEQPLVAGDTDSTSNLYECVLPGDSGGSLQRSGDVDPCPDLVRVSVPVSGGAEVQSVAAVSQDGSHVYFIAKGVLSGENAEHNVPIAGQDNLYVWEPGGRTAFIATLSSTAVKLGEAQATPDGEQLVFTSSADLTPDDTSTVAQLFLYEAQHETLIRVSKGQDGFNDDGNTTTDPASITAAYGDSYSGNGAAFASEGRRVISEDGSIVVFQSSAALTPQVHGGTRNVYMWRGGNVSLISDGTPAGEITGEGDAGLIGMDASGQNIFFATEARLVGQDKDELSDVYDARIDGGFPAPKVEECIGEACQGALPSSLGPVAPSSLSQNGEGNLAPAPAKSVSPPPPKPLTRAQRLAKALQACTRDKAKKKRTQCEATARKRFGVKHKAKKRKAGKRTGKGAK
jgi:hypothetical protein